MFAARGERKRVVLCPFVPSHGVLGVLYMFACRAQVVARVR